MSEARDYVAEAIARDRRFGVLQEAIAVERELRDSVTLRLLFAALADDGWQAMQELADTSPEDKVSMSDLLVRVRTHVYIRRLLEAIKRRGSVAEQSLLAEDQNRETDE